MGLFDRRIPPVQLGDRFVKADQPKGPVYEVSRLWVAADGLHHAHLSSLGGHRDTRIISVSALTDPRFFAPAIPLV